MKFYDREIETGQRNDWIVEFVALPLDDMNG